MASHVCEMILHTHLHNCEKHVHHKKIITIYDKVGTFVDNNERKYPTRKKEGRLLTQPLKG